MSNCGKSHWSSQLRSHKRFHLICVDDQIEKQITPELAQLGYSGINGMAKWMGFPSDERFAANQDRYLMHEERITSRAAPKPNRNTVLDTTGSVVYLSEKILRQLRTDYLVIHLEANDGMLEMMTDNYFETPKPVVWGDAFNPREYETPIEAMRRCYPGLLKQRRERYAKLAHITVPAAFSLSRDIDVEDFLEYVRQQLR
ncbi:hypothetical protein FGB62_16g162 [Gracilaria domingensis]|nr:hypothetical protein FGB62_16g162 [Gracilaria domingensis]